jgi:hypothetical protein
MPESDRSNSRPLPRWLRASLVSLTFVGLGLGRTVWGGPPAEDPPLEPADELGVDPTVTDTLPEADDLDSWAESAANDANTSVPEVGSLRAKMESGMATIGELAVEARVDEDLVRATCVLDKQDRANDVMDLGTSEVLIIRDAGTSEQARAFALEKLDAAAARIDKLVEEAKSCAGQQGPEDEVDITRTEADEPSDIPILDPSLGVGDNPIPPPLDAGWPPAASPIE